MKPLLILLVLLVSAGCGSDQPAAAPDAELAAAVPIGTTACLQSSGTPGASALLSDARRDPVASRLPRISGPAVEIEPPGSAGFGEIADAALLASGSIVVADGQAQTLHLFDPDGGYLTSGAGRGGGPGEFDYLVSVIVTPDDSILGVQRGRVSVFAQELTHARSVHQFNVAPRFDASRLRFPEVVGRFSDGSMLYLSRPASGGGEPPVEGEVAVNASGPRLLVRGTGEGEISDSVVQLPSGQYFVAATDDGWIFDGDLPFRSAGAVAVLAETVLLVNGDDYLIREIDVEGREVRSFGLCGIAPPPVQPAHIASWIASELEDEDPEILPRRRWALEAIPYPEHFHGLDALVVDREGLIWARERSLGSGSQEVWSVFSEEGAWLGRVPLPDGHELLDVGATGLLTRTTDSLGVQTASRVAIRRPEG